jgi:amino acid transporter
VAPPVRLTPTATQAPSAGASPSLRRALAARPLFALGFGGILGAGWVIALGGWLDQAGPLGAVAAFSVGGVIVSLIGVCCAEMMTTLPRSGGEVGPVVNVASTCFAVGYVLVCVGVIRLRRTRPALERPYRVPGGQVIAFAAAAAAVGMTPLSLQGPAAATRRRIPLEWWALVVWLLSGAVVWVATGRTRARVTEAEQRTLVAGI